MSFFIQGRKIGADAPPYIIAELSANHNGSLDRALKTIDAAHKAGADAILIHSKEKTPKEIFSFSKQFIKSKYFKPLVCVPSTYSSVSEKDLVKNKSFIDLNIETKKFKVIDARSKERFEGKIPEPRAGLRSGSIKNSFCIPYSNCLKPAKTFKNNKELKIVFETYIKNINEKNIVFSCGSGVTACVLALAYSLINDKYQPCIYDGSWAEYGII